LEKDRTTQTRRREEIPGLYRALGRDIRDWPLWGAFVDDFDSKRFRLSGVRRESLRRLALLKPFFDWISRKRERRLFSHTRMGEVDLVESAAKVKCRQTDVAMKIARLVNGSTDHAIFGGRKDSRRYFQSWRSCGRGEYFRLLSQVNSLWGERIRGRKFWYELRIRQLAGF
jgi:hypothetical protein